jgi:hypothetical protein
MKSKVKVCNINADGDVVPLNNKVSVNGTDK